MKKKYKSKELMLYWEPWDKPISRVWPTIVINKKKLKSHYNRGWKVRTPLTNAVNRYHIEKKEESVVEIFLLKA